MNGLDFDGIAIGGVAIGEPKKEMYLAVKSALPQISKDKPRYGLWFLILMINLSLKS